MASSSTLMSHEDFRRAKELEEVSAGFLLCEVAVTVFAVGHVLSACA